jgi:hypothetical protein
LSGREWNGKKEEEEMNEKIMRIMISFSLKYAIS